MINTENFFSILTILFIVKFTTGKDSFIVIIFAKLIWAIPKGFSTSV